MPHTDTASIPDSLRRAFDPESFRATGHRLVDQLADYLGVALVDPNLPVLPWKTPEAMLKQWPGNFPELPGGTIEEILARVVREANHLHSPRYIGHQVSAPLPAAALCDLTASLLNNGMAVYEMGPSGTAIERGIIRWMAGRLGMSESADGVLTSGGSVGNLTAMLAAREAKRELLGDRTPAILASEQLHYSVARTATIMGWGSSAIEAVPVDASYRMRPECLEEGLKRARNRGRHAIAVAANACCTATGTFDPLEPIAEFCRKHDLWLHVDAAHGGPACLSEKYRHLLKGIDQADSVVWDAHKMMMMPALVTAVIFRDGNDSYAAFNDKASYLFERDPHEEWYNISRRTLECTKRMLCLKLYACLQAYGTAMFGDFVTHTYDLARRFAEMLGDAPDFEVPVAPESNILCFRYVPAGGGDLDALQVRIRERLRDEGRFYIVKTELGGATYLRVTIINPFTTEEHLRLLMDELRGSFAGDQSEEKR